MMNLMRQTSALAIALGLLAAIPALAQSDIDPVGDILACRSIEDALERVACFDTAATALYAARSTGDIITVNAATIEAVEKESFGFSMPSLPRLGIASIFARSGNGAREARAPASDPLTSGIVAESEGAPSDAAEAEHNVRVVTRGTDGSVDEIVMRIARTETFGYNKVRFIMENGQVWKQVDSHRVRVPRNSDALEAYIRRAALGSFLLRINNGGRAIRVERSR